MIIVIIMDIISTRLLLLLLDHVQDMIFSFGDQLLIFTCIFDRITAMLWYFQH